MGYKQKQKELVKELEPLIEELHELELWHKEYQEKHKKKVINGKDRGKKIS